MLGSAGPLAVQLCIHLLGIRHCATVGFGPQCPVSRVSAMSAFPARAVARGQGHSLVQKEQRRIAVGFPLRHAAASERQGTGDPSLVLMVAHDVTGTALPVQSPAIAHPGAAARNGDDPAVR